MKLAVEKLASILESPDWAWMREMLEAHWDEVAKYKHIMKLAPDLERYQKLEATECLHVVIARDDNLKIVGYGVHFIIKGHPHYRQLTTAEDNIHYLVPALRGTGAHEQMRRFELRSLKERGVQFATARMKVGKEHDTTLRRIGFKPWDITYAIDLTDLE